MTFILCELSTWRYESSEILPFGPPRSPQGRWAKSSPLSTPIWITLEKASTYFSNHAIKKKKASLTISAIIFVATQKLTERRLAMSNIKRNKLDFTGQPIYVGLDVHKKSWSVSISTQYGQYKTFSQPPEVDKLVDYLQHHFPGALYSSAYEAGYCGFWIHDRLKEKGIGCLVVNPADVPTKNKERRGQRDDRKSTR